MLGLQDSHRFGIAVVILIIFALLYIRQKRSERMAMPQVTSTMPDMSAVTPMASGGGSSGLMPADTDPMDYAPYPSTAAQCATAQPFA